MSIWAALATEYIKSPIDNHQYTIAIHPLIENHKRKPKPQKPDPLPSSREEAHIPTPRSGIWPPELG